MSRRRRLYLWLSRVAAAAGVLLLIATVALWAISYVRGQYIKRTSWSLSATTDRWSTLHINYGSGLLEVSEFHQIEPAFVGNFISSDAPFRNDRTIPAGVAWDGYVLPLTAGAKSSDMRFGIASWRSRDRWSVQVALWLPALASLIIFGASILLLRHASRPLRRSKAGLCPTCGYDIRATPSQCPECGTSLAAYEWKSGANT